MKRFLAALLVAFLAAFPAYAQTVQTQGPWNSAQITGTATNNSASAGYLGEYISSTVLVGSAVTLTTGTPANVTSISLTAGDWEVCGTVSFNPGGTTTISAIAGGVSTTSAAFPTNPAAGMVAFLNATLTTGQAQQIATGCGRISVSGATTTFLVAQSAFATSTMSAFGFIGARRVR